MPTEATAVAVEAPLPPVIKLRRRSALEKTPQAARAACCSRTREARNASDLRKGKNLNVDERKLIVGEESQHCNAVYHLMRSLRVVSWYLYPMLILDILKLMEVAQRRGVIA